MTLTTLVTLVEPGEAAGVEAALATPFALAESFSAALTALVFPVEGQGATVDEDDTVARLRTLADRRAIACDIRSRSSFAYGVGEVLADHLRVSDLGVLGWHVDQPASRRLLLHAAIFDSGRPVVIAPEGRPLLAPPSRIMVAWDATPAAVRATHGALPFLRRAAETIVVTVADDKEVRAGQSGIELTHLLARHGATARFSAVRRGGGTALAAILAAAREAKAELLVMGGVRHAPLHNMIFGSTTQDLLDRGPQLATLIAA
ncbi:universal stress protein [Falsiroseomonas sp.]|uniref:universal stress protein n=1 Tax=Falsiroseomonas sp. TaxID=2870721 RepID=UPI0034A1E7C2